MARRRIIFPQAFLGISAIGLGVSIVSGGVIQRAGFDELWAGLAGLGVVFAVPLLLRLLGLAVFVGEAKSPPRMAIAAPEPEPVSLPAPSGPLPMRPTPKDKPEDGPQDLDKPSPREKRICHAGLGLIALTGGGILILEFSPWPDTWKGTVFGGGMLLGMTCILVSLFLYTLRLNRRP